MIDAVVNRQIDLECLEFVERLDDVEALNRAAIAGYAHATKLSVILQTPSFAVQQLAVLAEHGPTGNPIANYSASRITT